MRIVSMTDIGLIREINQDYLYVSEDPVGNLPNLFIVADGMGGHKAGEYASRLAVESIVGQVSESSKENPIEILDRAVCEANKLLLEYADSDSEMKGMGTTVVVATLFDRHLIVGNVGDSRLYVVSDAKATQITEDHSLVQEMVRMGQLDAEAAREHPDRNIITRALGAEPILEADFFEWDLNPGDKILLCTDGLHSMITTKEIFDVLHNGKILEKRVEQLVNLANKNGGKDNITVIVIEPDEVA